MTGSINRVTLLGRLGADPEIRSTQSGQKVANLRLATSESWKDKNTGEKKERTEWHSISVWGDGLVGVVERYAKKGLRLVVEGKLQTRKWQDQSGHDRYTTEIVVQGFGAGITLIDFPEDARANDADPHDRRVAELNAKADAAYHMGGGSLGEQIEDEIPFGPEMR